MTPSTPLRSTTRGDVPPEGPLRLGGIDLPAGLHVRPADDADFDAVDAVAAVSDAPPCAWVTDGAVEADLVEQWVRRLASRFEDTGLWPIAVTGYDDGFERPWRSGEVLGPDEGSPPRPPGPRTSWCRGGMPSPWRWPSSRPYPRPTP